MKITISIIHDNEVTYDTDSYEIGTDGFLHYIGKDQNPSQPIGLTNYDYMFAGRDDLKVLNLSHWNMQDMDTEDVYKMFSYNLEILNINFSNWNYICLSQFFYKRIEFQIVNTDKESNLEVWTYYCINTYYNKDQYVISRNNNLSYIGKSNKPDQPIGLTNYDHMFMNRHDLKVLDLSDWYLSAVQKMNFMFGGFGEEKEIIIDKDKCSDRFINNIISCNLKVTYISKKEEENNDMKKDEVVTVKKVIPRLEEVKIPRLEEIAGISKKCKVSKYGSNVQSPYKPISTVINTVENELECLTLVSNNIIKIGYSAVVPKTKYTVITNSIFDTVSVSDFIIDVKIIEYIDKDNIIVMDISDDENLGTFIISEDDISTSGYLNRIDITRLIDSSKELIELISSISNKGINVISSVKGVGIKTNVLSMYREDGKIIIDCDKKDGKYLYTEDLIKKSTAPIGETVLHINANILIKFEGKYYEIFAVKLTDSNGFIDIFAGWETVLDL